MSNATGGAAGAASPAGEDALRPDGPLLLDLVGVIGLVALLAGLGALGGSDQIGFDPDAAIQGVIGQLATTLPAAGLVAVAMALELASGLVLARWVRRSPFGSLMDAGLEAFVATVLKESLLIGSLGAVGLFRAPALLVVDVAIVLPAIVSPGRLGLSPLVAPGVRLPRPGDLPRSTGWWLVTAAVAIVWAGPIVLQLASPVVPFIDVLPNHVAPAEHLRTFGGLAPLDATQSPIYGPSRALLGVDALLGTAATLTGLPAGLAVAAFVLPSTILVALGVQRLARALAGDGTSIGPWALLAFAATESFARLGDARGTVIVVPLVLLALALTVDRMRSSASSPTGVGGAPPAPTSSTDPTSSIEPTSSTGRTWLGAGAGLPIGLAVGTAILVHPVIGAFTALAVVLLALVRPSLAPEALVASVTAVIVALPQLGIMLGVAVPTPALAIALVVAPAAGILLGRAIQARPDAGPRLAGLARWGRPAVALLVALGLIVAAAVGVLDPDHLEPAVGLVVKTIVDGCGVLLVGFAVALVLGCRAVRSWLVVVTAGIGFAAVLGTQLLPDNLGFLGDALKFEVPKTVYYWTPVFVAVAVGAGLAQLAARLAARRADEPASPLDAATGLRAVGLAAVVALVAVPLRPDPIDPYHLGEHRLSEDVAIDLHYAASGFWINYPDSRTVVDAPRQAILDAVRGEIDAGRIGPSTPILHVASSFQQWVSTPLGVFDGVTETFISPDREISDQTVGGRLYGPESLDGFLASHAYPYVLLEPDGLPAADRAAIVAAGYRSIFVNDQGELFTLDP